MELGRGEAVADQVGVGERQVDAHGAAFAPEPRIGEEPVQLRRRGVAPAVLAVALEGEERVEAPGLAARAQGRAQPPEGAAGLRNLEAPEARPVMGAQDQRAAEGVEAEGGVRVAELDPRDRHFGEQVRLDDVAERVVDPHPVEEGGDADALAEQRAGDEAAVGEVLLVGVVLDVDRRGARHLPIEEVVHRRLAVRLEIVRPGDLHAVGGAVGGDPRAGQRRDADDLDVRQPGRPAVRRVLGARRPGEQRRGACGRPARVSYAGHGPLPVGCRRRRRGE